MSAPCSSVSRAAEPSLIRSASTQEPAFPGYLLPPNAPPLLTAAATDCLIRRSPALTFALSHLCVCHSTGSPICDSPTVRRFVCWLAVTALFHQRHCGGSQLVECRCTHEQRWRQPATAAHSCDCDRPPYVLSE